MFTKTSVFGILCPTSGNQSCCSNYINHRHVLTINTCDFLQLKVEGAQWLSGRVLDSRPKGRGIEPHRRHCLVSLNKSINLSLVLVQPRKTRPFITERLLMGRKESNRTNKTIKSGTLYFTFKDRPDEVHSG